MPWEFLAGYAASKALDAARERAQPVARVFVERMGIRFTRTLADRYLRLSAQDLLTFYTNERPISATLAGHVFVLPASLVSAPTNAGELDSQRLSFTLLSQPFRAESSLDSYVEPVRESAARDKRLFDGKVVRLAALTSSEVGMAFSLCPASYFDALATNFAMDHRPEGRTETLRELLHGPSKSLGRFADSKLVNHIGVACMLETVDGMVVGQCRSAKVANRPKSLSASASGAVKFTDVRSPVGAPEFHFRKLANAVSRETFEELGVELKQLHFLGLVREFLRGGKPELYFYARSEQSMRQLIAKHRQVEGRTETKSLMGFEFHSNRVEADDSSRYSFQERVQRILEQCGHDANLTFVAGILLASGHVLRRAA